MGIIRLIGKGIKYVYDKSQEEKKNEGARKNALAQIEIDKKKAEVERLKSPEHIAADAQIRVLEKQEEISARAAERSRQFAIEQEARNQGMVDKIQGLRKK